MRKENVCKFRHTDPVTPSIYVHRQVDKTQSR